MLSHYRDGSGVFIERLTAMQSSSQLSEWELHEKHFAEARMSNYLLASNGDRQLAVELYLWNTKISSAFWELIGHVEVALRNLVSRQMAIRQVNLNEDSPWIFDESGELMRSSQRIADEISHATSRVRQNRKTITAEQLISELPFGFWHQLLSKKYLYLWPDLASGFVGLPNRSQEHVARILTDIRNLRNRIGHHHRIWNLDLQARHRDLMLLAKFIDPEFEAWLSEKSAVEALLIEMPVSK